MKQPSFVSPADESTPTTDQLLAPPIVSPLTVGRVYRRTVSFAEPLADFREFDADDAPHLVRSPVRPGDDGAVSRMGAA